MSDILWQALADAYIRGAQCVHDDHAKLIDWKAEAAPIAAECRNQVIRELIENVPEGLWGFSPSEQEAVSEWLKSQMEGE
jgi:hypothetical protein